MILVNNIETSNLKNHNNIKLTLFIKSITVSQVGHSSQYLKKGIYNHYQYRIKSMKENTARSKHAIETGNFNK